MTVSIIIMSGVEDGLVLNYDQSANGQSTGSDWILSIGRREESDVWLRNDSFVSRDHASLRRSHDGWWLTDNASKNGSFLESDDEDLPVDGTAPLQPGQLFRIGRTWLRLQPAE